MNSMVFSTGGDWDTTTLFNNGEEVMAAQLFVELHAGRDDYGNPAGGGVACGGEMTAIVRPQDDPQSEIGIFPGRIEIIAPGHSLIIENNHPAFVFEMTNCWYNGVDVTRNLMDLLVDVDSITNQVKAYITLFKPHWISADEVATYTIL